MTYPNPQKARGKDLLHAHHFGKTLVKPALILAGYPLLLGILSLVIGSVLMVENDFFRILLNGALMAMFALLIINSGAANGAKDAQHSVRLMQDINNGYQATDEDYAKAYHPLKGILSAVFGALPWLVMAVIVAVLAQPYTYQLQGMPTSYLGYYLRRWDLGAPVDYYNSISYSIQLADVLRILVRLGILPVVYMAGTVTDSVSLLLDHISPLLVLILPVLYGISYQFGPALRIREEKRTEEAIKQHNKKVKRKQKKERAQREKKKPEQLI